MENNLKNKVSQLVETSIDNIFSEVHSFAETSGGDILPEQVLQLKELQDGLSALVYNYLVQNMLPIPRGEEVYTSTEWKGDRWETRVDYSTGETEYYDQDGKIVSIVIDSIPYYAIK